MPVHSVELGHLVLLNIHVVDSGKSIINLPNPCGVVDHHHPLAMLHLAFKPSEFAIINTDGNSDFDIESRITLRDAAGRNLDLRLNYM